MVDSRPMSGTILRIAVPSPLRRLFDYLPPREAVTLRPGQRFLVPFGRSRIVGILVAVTGQSELPRENSGRPSSNSIVTAVR